MFLKYFLTSVCNVRIETLMKNQALGPRKPVPIYQVGPIVFHHDILGLILIGSEPLPYLKNGSSERREFVLEILWATVADPGFDHTGSVNLSMGDGGH